MFAPDAWIIARTGRHRTTIARWRRTRRFPPELEALAALELGGELGIISAAWQGWTLDRRTSELCAPGRWLSFSVGELLAAPLRDQERRALASELARIRRRRSWRGLWQAIRAAINRPARAETSRATVTDALGRRRRRWHHHQTEGT